MSQAYVNEWEIPIGSALIVVRVSAPGKGTLHTGARLEAQGRAIAKLGRAVKRIRIALVKELEGIDAPAKTSTPEQVQS